MADEKAKTETPAPKKGLPIKLIGIVLGIAAVQGAAFFFVFKGSGAKPHTATAEPAHAIEPEPEKPVLAVAEVQLLKGFKVPNDKSGRMCLYDIDLSVVVAAEQKEKMKKIAEERAGEIADSIGRIVRAASEPMLREDDLRTLRAQFTDALTEIVQSRDLIQRVLIPRFVPLPS
jgi:flagellar basal body-associated protein FliL